MCIVEYREALCVKSTVKSIFVCVLNCLDWKFLSYTLKVVTVCVQYIIVSIHRMFHDLRA